MAPQYTALIAEDDPSLNTLLRYTLEKETMTVICTDNGDEVMAILDTTPIDVIVLDWMIAGLSGVDVCRRLRANARYGHIPVIMLSARTEEVDKIQGLDAGADDYMVKPFSPRELIARIRALLRRTSPIRDENGTVSFEDIVMDLNTHRVYRDGEMVHLGPTEYQLLQVFLRHPGQVFSRSHLLQSAWRRDAHVEDRTVDVHIRRLRKALNENGRTNFIRTVRAVGYALDKASD